MKACVQLFPAGSVLDAHRLLERRELVVGPLEPGPPSRIAVADRLAQRLDLDVQAQPRQILQVFQRHRRDAKAALALGRHQSVAHEPRDRLAQSAGADAVVRLQVLDAQFFAGRQTAFDDVVAQLRVGAFDQRA